MTRRGQLISQLRWALNELTRPADEDEEIVFDIAETDFSLTQEDLRAEIIE